MASLVNKHANLVLAIKTQCADEDDPGLEELIEKLAVCNPHPSHR